MNRPERMCIGCRGRDHKSALIRLVWNSAAVAVDLHQTEPGRGAYLHRTSECLDQAVRRRVIGRALRVTQPDGRELSQVLAPLVSTGPPGPGDQPT